MKTLRFLAKVWFHLTFMPSALCFIWLAPMAFVLGAIFLAVPFVGHKPLLYFVEGLWSDSPTFTILAVAGALNMAVMGYILDKTDPDA